MRLEGLKLNTNILNEQRERVNIIKLLLQKKVTDEEFQKQKRERMLKEQQQQ